MGEMREYFDGMREVRKANGDRRLAENMAVLDEAGVEFESRNDGRMLMFRGGSRQADFYPGTGNWKVIGGPKHINGQLMHGGAKSFLGWLRKG